MLSCDQPSSLTSPPCVRDATMGFNRGSLYLFGGQEYVNSSLKQYTNSMYRFDIVASSVSV